MRRSRWLLLLSLLALAACGRILGDDPAANDTPDGDASVAGDGGSQPQPDGTVDSTDATLDGASAPDFPFDLTFEDGLVGPHGANEPSRAELDETTPLFGDASARFIRGEAPSVVRKFAARDSIYLTFYLRIEEPVGDAIVFELRGTSRSIIRLRATSSDAGDNVVFLDVLNSGSPNRFDTVAVGATYRVGVQCEYRGADAGSLVLVHGGLANAGLELRITAAVDPLSGPPSRVILGNDDASAGMSLTVDDAFGRPNDFAPPSQ